jgi:iron complex transport system substrate-binding protein
MNRRDVLMTGLTLCMASLGPAKTQGRKRAIVDAIGLHTVLDRPTERVVIASHFSYEDFTAIAGVDGWSKVVGFAREPWEGWRAGTYAEYAKVIPNLATLPDVGTLGHTFDAAKVISLKPDVVLLEAFSDILIGEQVRKLRAADIPVVFFDFQSETPAKYAASVAAIGLALGAEARAGELIRLYESLHSDVMQRVPATDPFTKSVYAEVAETAPDVVGWTDANRLWGGMALNLHALNIANGKVPDYGGQLAHAELVAADPDLIFFAGGMHPSYSNGVRTGYGVSAATTLAGLAAYAGRPGYDQLKAVRAGAVHAVDHSLVWSLRDVFGLQYMAKQLYPAQFADIDPVKGLADFHARFLPVPFSGTWFQRLGDNDK